MSKQPNSQECVFYGRKLSNIICDDIEVSEGYVVIGSDSDDQIYFGDCLKDNEVMLKERVVITALKDGEEGYCIDIDLEDILRFARKNCNGIYERVMKEVTPYDEVKK